MLNLGWWCVEVCGKRKVYQYWIIQICEILKTHNWTKRYLYKQDKLVCGILGGYFIAFFKIITSSSSIFLEGFWLSNNWKFNYVRAFLPPTMEVVNAKDLIITPYHGLKNLKTFLKIATSKIHHVLKSQCKSFFSWSCIVLSLFLCGWEEHKVLLNVTKMNFSESLGGLAVGSNIKKLLNIDEQSLYVDC